MEPLDLDFLSENKIIDIVKNIYLIYINNGSRSPSKVLFFHKEIKNVLSNIFKEEKGYNIEIEKQVLSTNSSFKKRCDIVISRKGKIEIIIPTKIIMSNFKQNRNNYFENLTGEICHLKWANENVFIIPINIFMNETVYLTKNKIIKKFERVEYKDFQSYKILLQKGLCYNIVNIIMDVKHNNNIGEVFKTSPFINNFNILYGRGGGGINISENKTKKLLKLFYDLELLLTTTYY